MRRLGRGNRDNGASLIEFALIMPLLVLLIFGMVDAGWAFFQNLEVRHGAREAARLAAVDAFDGDAQAIITATCQRITSSDPNVSITVDVPAGDTSVGSTAEVTVSRNPHNSLTGFLPFFNGLNLTTTVQIRIEQQADWYSGTPIVNDCATANP